MRRINFPEPTRPQLIEFIIHNCGLERIEVSSQDIDSTISGELLQPDPLGHFRAIEYVIKMAGTTEVPAKCAASLLTPKQTHDSLFWLRKIHELLMTPISIAGQNMGNQELILIQDVGQYRLTPRMIRLDYFSPKPELIKPLLGHWLKQISEFHFTKAPKTNALQPLNVIKACEEKAWLAHLQLQCIHPFTDGTGRTARLVENLLRLTWGLPWKTIKMQQKQKYVEQIMTYENSNEWQTILKTIQK